MATIIVFDTVSGIINRMVSCPNSMVDSQAQEGEAWISGEADPRTQYVNVSTRVVENRPTMDISLSKTEISADGVDAAILNGPSGALLMINGPIAVEFTLDGTPTDITTDIPGTYDLTISLFPYLEWEAQIVAT